MPLEIDWNKRQRVKPNDSVKRISVGLLAVFLVTVSTAAAAVDSRYLYGLGDARYQQIDSEVEPEIKLKA